MKVILISILITLTITPSHSQQVDYNLQKGYIAEGFDLVSYFNNKNPVKGKTEYSLQYDGITFLFANEENLKLFQSDPQKYLPQYGGWCAYAMGTKGEKVSVDPKTYEIRDGKLYLFYNAYFNNTLDSWKKEGPEKLRSQADNNWGKIKFKKSE